MTNNLRYVNMMLSHLKVDNYFPERARLPCRSNVIIRNFEQIISKLATDKQCSDPNIAKIDKSNSKV